MKISGIKKFLISLIFKKISFVFFIKKFKTMLIIIVYYYYKIIIKIKSLKFSISSYNKLLAQNVKKRKKSRYEYLIII